MKIQEQIQKPTKARVQAAFLPDGNLFQAFMEVDRMNLKDNQRVE